MTAKDGAPLLELRDLTKTYGTGQTATQSPQASQAGGRTWQVLSAPKVTVRSRTDRIGDR